MSNATVQEFLTLHELVIAAREKLTDSAWAYITGGADTETSMQRNRAAIDSLALRPRVLNDVSSVDCTATLFGSTTRLPVFLCPVGGLEVFDPKGALSVAIAAKSFGVPMLLSSVSEWSPAQLIGQLSNELKLVLQLYVRTDAAGVDECVEKCMQLDRRAKGVGDAAKYQASVTWKDIERIRKIFNNQLVLKGIATREDALLAVEHGVDVVYVSNHGGRQLDHGLGSIAALVDIVEAVDGRAIVLVDGGFSRGTDIAKAIALGADGVGLGRMMCFALAAEGPVGVQCMLELLEEEYRIALALLGVQNRHHDSALVSAFPLLKDAGL